MEYDIITFGSGARDTFLVLKRENYRILKNSICFKLGSKIDIEDIKVFTGGGGTNSACTFSKQGFKVAYCGKVGKDKRGEAIIEELKEFGVRTELIKKDRRHPTNYSVILSSPGLERTILVHRGASSFLRGAEIPWKRLTAQWFYLAPLSGKLAGLFGQIVNFAKKNKIKVAANLGNSQINFGIEKLRPILAQLDVLILNQEEASLLTKVSVQKEREIIRKLKDLTSGIIVVTKGRDGSMVFDGKYIFRAGTSSLKFVERTGAGDAFGAGFVSGFIRKRDIIFAIQLGTANAAACIQEIGAKNGLLNKNKWGRWPKVKVEKEKL